MQSWNYSARNRFPNASDRLASVMNQNPYLKILVCGGRCDLVCPIDTMRHSVDAHAAGGGLPEERAASRNLTPAT